MGIFKSVVGSSSLKNRRNTMKTEFIKQYAHTWKVFELLVADFDPDAWIHTGRKTNTPVHLAFHILKSVKFYIEDSSPILFTSGKTLDTEWKAVNDADLPTQNDILGCIKDLKVNGSLVV
jgi:hypothetical protein